MAAAVTIAGAAALSPHPDVTLTGATVTAPPVAVVLAGAAVVSDAPSVSLAGVSVSTAPALWVAHAGGPRPGRTFVAGDPQERAVRAVPADRECRYGAWQVAASAPSAAELDVAASRRYAIAFANADRAGEMAALKTRDPGVIILMYVCLQSVRQLEGADGWTSGVTYDAAHAAGWIAKDDTGADLAWPQYPGHYQATVWDASYRAAWIERTMARVSSGPWDGVWADNDMTDLSGYWPAGRRPAGTSSVAAANALVAEGCEALVIEAGRRLRAAGKRMCVNYQEGRRDLARHAKHARAAGGITEEFLANWDAAPGATPTYVNDGYPGDWADQLAENQPEWTFLALTAAAEGDVRVMRYGYASHLMRAQPGDAWAPLRNGPAPRQWLPEEGITLGPPMGAARRLPGGAWARRFLHGFAAVNPTDGTCTITRPDGSTTTLGPRTGGIWPA